MNLVSVAGLEHEQRAAICRVIIDVADAVGGIADDVRTFRHRLAAFHLDRKTNPLIRRPILRVVRHNADATLLRGRA